MRHGRKTEGEVPKVDQTVSLSDVVSWWDAHSQDYVEDKGTYRGFDLQLNDAEFRRRTQSNDAWFRHQAYFAHTDSPDAPLFDALIDYQSLKGRIVLEVGCGLGSHAEEFVRQNSRLVGIDISTTSTRATQRRLKLNGLSGAVVQASAEKLPFRRHSIDFVWSWGVIHHSPDTQRAANEILRVLKPGGRFGIMIYHFWSWWAVVGILFRYGVLRGQLLRHSRDEVLRAYSDGKNVGGAPIVRYYTRLQARQMFSGASQIKIRTFGTKAQILNALPSLAGIRHCVSRITPNLIYRWFFICFGNLMLVNGAKPKTNTGDGGQQT